MCAFQTKFSFQKLSEYEQTVAVAANEGIDLSNKEPIYQWSYIQAVFFTSTILTTIGRDCSIL